MPSAGDTAPTPASCALFGLGRGARPDQGAQQQLDGYPVLLSVVLCSLTLGMRPSLPILLE